MLAALLASFAFGKPLVYVLATGGTIAGSAAGGATDTAYRRCYSRCSAKSCASNK
ncbi:hypothetical protein [Campylobacter sp.]|uniref:hypothetical protein n=1 Tax=Campylobacter sp. TaxID=205 RepID=UPI002AA831A1|nr:hypothetical protein [Campylobacter sp.]MCI7076837.1 hypothetical protein [Campylobacter sp.]